MSLVWRGDPHVYRPRFLPGRCRESRPERAGGDVDGHAPCGRDALGFASQGSAERIRNQARNAGSLRSRTALGLDALSIGIILGFAIAVCLTLAWRAL